MGTGIADEQREEMEFEMAIQLSRQEYEAEMRGQRQSKGSEERPNGAATPDSGTVCEEDELPIAAKRSTGITNVSSENAINRMDAHRQDADDTEHMSGDRVSATPASSATADGKSRAPTNRALTPPASQSSRAPGDHDQPPSDPIQQLRADNAELKTRVAGLLDEKAAYSIREAATLMREAANADREANLLRRVKELEDELDTYKELVFPLNAK